MKIFWTDRSYRRHLNRIVNEVAEKAAWRLWVYSSNETLLRKAVAAQMGVSENKIIPGSMLLIGMQRALRAYAEAITDLNNGDYPNAQSNKAEGAVDNSPGGSAVRPSADPDGVVDDRDPTGVRRRNTVPPHGDE